MISEIVLLCEESKLDLCILHGGDPVWCFGNGFGMCDLSSRSYSSAAHGLIGEIVRRLPDQR